MPQPRKPDPAALVELLSKGLVLTTDRIQAVLDDAVRRGRMTRADAEELVATLVETGRKQSDELRRDIEGLVSRVPGVPKRKSGS
jgi:polyhydroxyalkanoate synthesis regulator phasin